MKNTKGKWEIKAPSGMLGVGVVSVYTGYDDKKEVICEISALGDRGKTIANANLIASAPEMLKALKNIANFYFESTTDFQDEVYALIARAEGK